MDWVVFQSVYKWSSIKVMKTQLWALLRCVWHSVTLWARLACRAEAYRPSQAVFFLFFFDNEWTNIAVPCGAEFWSRKSTSLACVIMATWNLQMEIFVRVLCLEASLQACLQWPWMVWRPACQLACSALGWQLLNGRTWWSLKWKYRHWKMSGVRLLAVPMQCTI